MLLQMMQNLFQVVQIFSIVCTSYQDVIQIADHMRYALTDVVHGLLEQYGC